MNNRKNRRIPEMRKQEREGKELVEEKRKRGGKTSWAGNIPLSWPISAAPVMTTPCVQCNDCVTWNKRKGDCRWCKGLQRRIKWHKAFPWLVNLWQDPNSHPETPTQCPPEGHRWEKKGRVSRHTSNAFLLYSCYPYFSPCRPSLNRQLTHTHTHTLWGSAFLPFHTSCCFKS